MRLFVVNVPVLGHKEAQKWTIREVKRFPLKTYWGESRTSLWAFFVSEHGSRVLGDALDRAGQPLVWSCLG